MADMQLGRLERVELRDIWVSEGVHAVACAAREPRRAGRSAWHRPARFLPAAKGAPRGCLAKARYRPGVAAVPMDVTDPSGRHRRGRVRGQKWGMVEPPACSCS
jgi:hypothetical protein